MIKVDNLSYSYGSTQVLSSLSFHWKKNNLVSLIGENGSGKSTLLKLLCGIYKASDPSVIINGKKLNELTLREKAKTIAYVPQHPLFEAESTVFDSVLLGRKPWFHWRESRRDRELVSSALEKFGIIDKSWRQMGMLSGGERQKVFIARAYVQNTPILLLDEPTNNLDISFQMEMMDLLTALTEKDKLIVAALHDINLALRYSGETLLLKNGKTIAGGTTESALTEEFITRAMDIESEIIEHKGINLMVPGPLFT